MMLNCLLSRITVLHMSMQPTVTDVVWSVGLSARIVSPAKIAELIKMPLRLCTPAGPRKHKLDGVQISH